MHRRTNKNSRQRIVIRIPLWFFFKFYNRRPYIQMKSSKLHSTQSKKSKLSIKMHFKWICVIVSSRGDTPYNQGMHDLNTPMQTKTTLKQEQSNKWRNTVIKMHYNTVKKNYHFTKEAVIQINKSNLCFEYLKKYKLMTK